LAQWFEQRCNLIAMKPSFSSGTPPYDTRPLTQ
jgi:hypothetical protein